jgi:hypothetical protein
MAHLFSSGASVLLSLYFALATRPLSYLVAGLVLGAAWLAYMVANLRARADLRKRLRRLRIRSLREKGEGR